MSSPLGPVYIGSLNLPPKKFSIPAPLGFVELPTTTRAARSTRDVEMEAGWVAATPATLVATPTAAMLIASLAPRFLPDLAIPTSSPPPHVANVRFRASYARSRGRRQGGFDEFSTTTSATEPLRGRRRQQRGRFGPRCRCGRNVVSPVPRT